MRCSEYDRKESLGCVPYGDLSRECASHDGRIVFTGPPASDVQPAASTPKCKHLISEIFRNYDEGLLMRCLDCETQWFQLSSTEAIETRQPAPDVALQALRDCDHSNAWDIHPAQRRCIDCGAFGTYEAEGIAWTLPLLLEAALAQPAGEPMRCKACRREVPIDQISFMHEGKCADCDLNEPFAHPFEGTDIHCAACGNRRPNPQHSVGSQPAPEPRCDVALRECADLEADLCAVHIDGFGEHGVFPAAKGETTDE